MSGTSGQIDYMSLGQHHPHFLAFERVVVEERERVDADIQFGRELPDILCFAFPVDSRRGEMIEPQQHRIMLLEYFQRILGIVFAAYREDDAAATQIKYRALHLQVCISRVL